MKIKHNVKSSDIALSRLFPELIKQETDWSFWISYHLARQTRRMVPERASKPLED
jgi:hypothetical protein